MLIMCLALNIYFEAALEPELGQIAVSHVVMNRVDDTSPQWPGDACDIVFQKSKDPKRPKACQFSWTCDDRSNIYRTADNEEFNKIYLLAYDIFYGKHHFDPTNGALHYVVCGTKTNWHQDRTFLVKIGAHCYYD